MARIVDVSGRFDVGPYIARQSWISTFSQPTPIPDVPSELSSRFQQRMVENDFGSSLRQQLQDQADEYDAVLIDLIDERYGVVPTAQGYVTNSYELRNSGWKKLVSTGDVLSLGSAEHLALWRSAADNLSDSLERLEVLDKAFFIDTKYAHRTDSGETFEDRNLPPAVRDAQFAPYYEHLEHLPIGSIKMPSEVTIADSQHTWGIEPFHYVRAYYKYMADELEAKLLLK